MRSKTPFLVAAIVVAGFAVSAELSTNAQGLKGAQMPPQILGRVIYVKGNTDQERWKNFLEVQNKLIGMTFNQADEALCGKISHKVITEAEYGLTQEQVKVGKTKGCLYVRVFFRDGFVWKYSVEASH